MPKVLTIGHSTHSPDGLLALLHQHGVTAVADVRSTPRSRFIEHVNAPALKNLLAVAGISYVPLGEDLGARPKDRSVYVDGVAAHARIAATDWFQRGLGRVIAGAARYRICLLCAEKDPLDCHRAVLVGRHLQARGVQVSHIHSDGTLESRTAFERRLMSATRMDKPDLFSPDDPVQRAYDIRSEQIAFTEREAGVREVVDVRLHNTSQLAGFAKADDLAYFLETMGIGYRHAPELAPTDEMLSAYRGKKMSWDDYAATFTRLIAERHVEQRYSATSLSGACLLCSEDTPHRCHRRLVAEYVTAATQGAPAVRHL
ncbi:MAG: DUF488 domain-containing protein [Acetobacteraceae bacterium]|nr:DUF488 domain-containing protein [Acetobacteraceae bacterium]